MTKQTTMEQNKQNKQQQEQHASLFVCRQPLSVTRPLSATIIWK